MRPSIPTVTGSCQCNEVIATNKDEMDDVLTEDTVKPIFIPFESRQYVGCEMMSRTIVPTSCAKEKMIQDRRYLRRWNGGYSIQNMPKTAACCP
jgi:hypothetical protein